MNNREEIMKLIAESLGKLNFGSIPEWISSHDRRLTAVMLYSKQKFNNQLTKRGYCRDIQTIFIFGNGLIDDSNSDNILLDYCQFDLPLEHLFSNWRIVQEPIILAFPINTSEPTILNCEVTYDKSRFPNDSVRTHVREDGSIISPSGENYEEYLENIVLKFNALNNNGDPLENVKYSYAAFLTVVVEWYFGG